MGGVTTAAVNLCNELAKQSHEVVLLDLSGEYLCRDLLADGVKLGSLSGRSRYWNLGAETLKKSHGFKKLALCALGVFKKIAIRLGLWHSFIFKKYKEHKDIDVAIAFRQCAPCYSFVLNKVNAKKKLSFVHGELKYMGDISSWLKYMCRYDRICYVCESVKNEFCKKYPYLSENASAVYNMFDAEKINVMSKAAAGIELSEGVNIVTVARVENDFKRINLIPEICKQLKEKSSKTFRWYIVGDGPDMEEDIAICKNNNTDDVLCFVGRRENPFPILTAADFSVLTSKSEAYPMTVIESLILQVPVVAMRFGAICEMITDGYNGIIAEQSIDSIVEKLLSLIENEGGIRDRLKANCKKEITNEKAYGQLIAAIGDI